MIYNLKIRAPSTKELEDYLEEVLVDNEFNPEEGEFNDDSVMELREILLDYFMDNLEVEVN